MVWNIFYFSIIIIPTDYCNIFHRGRYTTNQMILCPFPDDSNRCSWNIRGTREHPWTSTRGSYGKPGSVIGSVAVIYNKEQAMAAEPGLESQPMDQEVDLSG